MRYAKSISAFCLMLIFASITAYGWTEELSGGGKPSLVSFQRSLAALSNSQKSSASIDSRDPGTPASESIKGNGTRVGYTLGHTGIVEGSVTLSVDGVAKVRGIDYFTDSSGSITFTEAITANQSVQVSYKYVSGQDSRGSSTSGPNLALNFGGGSTMGLSYGSSPVSGSAGTSMLTYGMNMNSKLNAKSSMSNMLYMSTPQSTGKIALNDSNSGTTASKLKSDRMFVNNTDLQSGKMNLKFDFQDVGKDFSGFNTLRLQNSTPKEKLDQLEKEKGIRRMGFQAGYEMGQGSSSILRWNSVKDDGGEILNQALNFGTKTMNFSANIQKVDKGFTRFNDLAEANRAQLAKEVGMERRGISLGFAPQKGLPAGTAWNSLNFNDIMDASGKVSLRSLNLVGKTFSLQANETSIDQGFARLGSLSADDVKSIGLGILQQFDQNANVNSLTDADRQKILSQTGINRRNIRGNFALNGMSLGMQSLSVGDQTGKLGRYGISLQSKTYSLNWFTQDIDAGYTGLQNLTPVEQRNFGNEHGMHRMNFNGDFAFNPTTKLSTYMSNVKEDDAGVTKYGMSLSSKKFSFAANYQDIDPNFTRVLDLADGNKTSMLSEIGMSRYDLTTHFQASNSLAFDNFFYDAKHKTSDIFKRQMRNNVTWSPKNGPQITFFRDQVSSGTENLLTTSTHQTFSINHRFNGMYLSAVQDTVQNRSSNDTNNTISTRTYHMDTDPAKRMVFSGDWKRMDNSDSTFVDARTMKLTSTLSDSLKFFGTRTDVQTDAKLTTSDEYGLTGRLSGSLNFVVKYGNTVEDGRKIGTIQQYSVVPCGPKDYGALKQLTWALSYAEVRNEGKLSTQSNGMRLSFQAMEHTFGMEYNSALISQGVTPLMRSFRLASNADPKKPIHYDFLYKSVETNDGQQFLIRKYNIDWRINNTSQLVYAFTTMDEKALNVYAPIYTERFRLNTAIGKQLTFICQWQTKDDDQSNDFRHGMSVGLSGKPSNKATLEALFGVDQVECSTQHTSAQTYHLRYAYQLDADHYLTFNGNVTDWNGKRPSNVTMDDAIIQLDYKTVFN